MTLTSNMWLTLVLITALTNSVFATTHHVDVGRTGLNFNPSVLHNVATGDIVNFHFYPSNHSVAESTFDKPCKPRSGGVDARSIYSGFVPVEDDVANEMFSVTIDRTDPIWLYCSQGEHQHCRNGQSMVINPLNNTDQTLDAYMQAALNANVSSPTEVYGGVMVEDDGGQPQQGPQARPSTSVHASSSSTATTSNTAAPTNGAVPLVHSLVEETAVWAFLAAVFVVTL